MAASTPPRAVNWTTVTGLCTVFTFILLLSGLLCAAAWYIGRQANQLENLEQRVKEAERIAGDAQKLQVYNSRQTDEKDGHAIKGKEKK
jgi:hypothetical protein